MEIEVLRRHGFSLWRRYSVESQLFRRFEGWLDGYDIETFAVERLVGREHTVDGDEKFAHDGADDLHGGFAASREVFGVGLDVGIVGLLALRVGM